ncbi:hypothetical protein BH09MYX1_BH09MYX1_14560 [soil metagenome]
MLLVLVGLSAAVLVVLFMRSRRGASAPEVDRNEKVLDAWVVSEIAPFLRERMPDGVEPKHVTRTLDGDPDPDVVSALEDVVRTVEVEFLKDALDGGIEVVLRVQFEDGTERVQRSRRTLAELPARVRADFESKALTRSRLVWGFPWARANASSAFH